MKTNFPSRACKGSGFLFQKLMEKENKRGGTIFSGVAGELYVAAEISRRGAIATITAKNTPDIDVIGTTKDGSRTAIIQVKAGRSDGGGFIVGTSAMREYPPSSFHVFVLMKNDEAPKFWIIPSNTVANIAETDYQNWLKKKAIATSTAPRKFDWKHLKSEESIKRYQNQWELLGIFPQKAEIKT